MSFRSFQLPAIVVIALLFCSTTSIAQKKNSLLGHPVKKLEVKTKSEEGVSIGGSMQIGVVATLDDGSTLSSKGFLKGKVKWKDFNVDVQTGSFSGLKGSVSPSADPSKVSGHAITVKVSSMHIKALSDEISIPVVFDKSYIQSFTGKSGGNGSKGSNASNASEDYSIYNQSKGTQGNSADHGGQGGRGGNGENGPTIEIWANAVSHAVSGQPLLQVFVKQQNSSSGNIYVLDPAVASLSLTSVGGTGGNGGAGGNGGKGGKGGNVTNNDSKWVGGNGGNGGNGGSGGQGGQGGTGGSFVLYYDQSAAPYIGKISMQSVGGKGGSGGSGGSYGLAGPGGNGYYSGDPGKQGKSGKRGGSGSKGNNGPAPQRIQQSVDLTPYGLR